MLERQDLQAIQEIVKNIVDERIDKTEKRLEGKIQETEKRLEGKIQETEKRLEGKIQETEKRLEGKIQETEDFLLDEIGRTHTHLDQKIDNVVQDTAELKKIYRIVKLDTDNTTILLKKTVELDERVSALETKIS